MGGVGSDFSKRLNLSSEDGEKWIVNLARDSRLGIDAKIDLQAVSTLLRFPPNPANPLPSPAEHAPHHPGPPNAHSNPDRDHAFARVPIAGDPLRHVEEGPGWCAGRGRKEGRCQGPKAARGSAAAGADASGAGCAGGLEWEGVLYKCNIRRAFVFIA